MMDNSCLMHVQTETPGVYEHWTWMEERASCSSISVPYGLVDKQSSLSLVFPQCRINISPGV